MKRRIPFLLLVLVFFIGCMCGQPVHAAEKKGYESMLESSMTMYQGDATFFDLQIPEDTVYSAISTNPEVVRISRGTGKIKAVAPGKATLLVKVRKKEALQQVKIHVTVRYSSYMSNQKKGTGVKHVTGKARKLVFHNVIYTGKSFAVKMKTPEGAKLKFQSSKSSVAAVDENGTVTGITPGSSVIAVRVRYKGVLQKYYVRVYVKDEPQPKITESQVNEYFKGQAISGNSVALGYTNYCNAKLEGYTPGLVHLTAGSYSFLNDRAAIKDGSLHPKYQGRKYRVKDGLHAAGCKHVYLEYGANDINIFGVLGTADEYKAFIKEIQAANPGIKVTILSMTPVLRASGRINNSDIKRLNQLLADYASEAKDVDYVDINTPLLDSTGKLKAEYCSDAFCHLTAKAYVKWAEALREYARKQLVHQIAKEDEKVNRAAGL